MWKTVEKLLLIGHHTGGTFMTWIEKLFIEEFSMVPNKWITMMYKAFVIFGNWVYLISDPNQCSTVEGGRISYNCLDSDSVHEMCPQVNTLMYTDNSAICIKSIYEMFGWFLKTRKVNIKTEKKTQCVKNICCMNATGVKVNKECCDRFSDGKETITVDFK